jgi:hypothetical protein
MHLSRVFGLTLILSACLSGCTLLKKVNDYSNSSLRSIQGYEKLKGGFTEAYIARLRQQQFKDYSNVTFLEVDSSKPLPGSHVTLAQVKSLDSSMTVIYYAIEGYFTGLARLSADSLTNYRIDTITNPLVCRNIIDTTAVSPATVSAYSTIAHYLAVALTNEYRAKHIKKYVAQADEPIRILIGKFSTNLKVSLYTLLETQRQAYRDEYYLDLLSKAAPGFGKKQVIEDYQQQIDGIRSKELMIDTYTRCLDSVAAGHAYLAAHLHELKAKDVKDAMAGYASVIKDMYFSFNTIKKSMN